MSSRGHKEKARRFLTTERLQLPWDFTSDAVLSARNIKTETDLAQYRSSNNADSGNTGKSRISKHAETINQALGRLADRVELVSDVRQTRHEIKKLCKAASRRQYKSYGKAQQRRIGSKVNLL